MSTIVLRSVKGSALTFAEGDDNFNNLNTDKLESISEDTTPQLGGDLDLNNFSITQNDDNPITVLTVAGVAGSPDTSINLTTAAGQYIKIREDITNTDISINAASGTTFNGGLVKDTVLQDYAETIYAIGTTDSPTITISNGNVQTVTISSALALPAFSDAAAGQSVTLLVDGTGTASGTGAYVFAGGNKTLTTSSVVSIFYDGTTYWTSIATDFQA